MILLYLSSWYIHSFFRAESQHLLFPLFDDPLKLFEYVNIYKWKRFISCLVCMYWNNKIKNICLTSTITIINKKYFNVFFSNQLILYIYSWDLYVCVWGWLYLTISLRTFCIFCYLVNFMATYYLPIKWILRDLAGFDY